VGWVDLRSHQDESNVLDKNTSLMEISDWYLSFIGVLLRSIKQIFSCKIDQNITCEKMLTAVEEIESAILKLSQKELGQLVEWVLDLDEQN
jgi:hypothetical protein